MSMKPYTLSSEQVEAILELLYIINLNRLVSSGKVMPLDDENSSITREQGKVISDLFYETNFGDEVDTESE